MQLKVNTLEELTVHNCFHCPLAMHSNRYANRCGHPKIRSEGYQVFFDKNEVLPNCPLKNSPLTIKLNENESK